MAFKMKGFSGFKKETQYLDDKTNPPKKEEEHLTPEELEILNAKLSGLNQWGGKPNPSAKTVSKIVKNK